MSFCTRITPFLGLMTVIMLFLTSCGSLPPLTECKIAPPKDYDGNQTTAQKIGVDLTALITVPIKANIENELKSTTHEVFQQLSDKNTACHMLLNTVACLNKQPDGQPLANKLLVYLINGKQCGERTGPDSMAEFDKAVSGDYVGISNQINNEQHPRKRPVDLAKIPHQMMEDIVHLTVKDGVVSGKSEGQGMVWENSGYLRDGVLVLAYRTAGSQGRGFGTHLLVNQDDRDVEVYAGYLEGRDCTVEAIIKYPYILVRGKPGSNEVNRAKIKYADMLKQHGALVDPLVCIQ